MHSQKIYINDSQEEKTLTYLRKIWTSRELIYSLVKKDLIVKLSKTLFGRLWLILPSILTIIIYSIFFGQLLKLDTGQSPYPLFLISGLVLWNLFSQSSGAGANALIANQHIIKKTPFPKIILNISATLLSIIEQIPLLILLLALTIFYQRPALHQLIVAPFIYFILVFLALGVGNFLANFSIMKRDIIHAYSFILQIMLWITPVFYPTTIIPENFVFLIYFNPLTGLLDLFRWSLNIQELQNHYYIYSILISFIILYMSIILYKKNEKSISDYI